MRKTTNGIERFRVREGPMGSNESFGFNGAFFVPWWRDPSITFKIICSCGMGWEHVSISLPHRCPSWDEMCWLKDLFWEEEEAVMQLHPPKSTWVNNVRTCLHLWRPTDEAIPLPPEHLVGIKDLGVIP